jgi:hypothetical protein
LLFGTAVPLVGRNRFIAPPGLAKGCNAVGYAKRRNKAIAPYDPLRDPTSREEKITSAIAASRPPESAARSRFA